MRDGALKWGLRLLGLFLFIAPILIAFSINDWDVRKTVLPGNDEIDQIQNKLSSIIGGGISQDTITYEDYSIGDGNISLTVAFQSPVNVPLTILSVNLGVNDQGIKVAELHLRDSAVEVPANGTVEFTLVGTYSGGAPAKPRPDTLSVAFEVYGVTIESDLLIGGQP